MERPLREKVFLNQLCARFGSRSGGLFLCVVVWLVSVTSPAASFTATLGRDTAIVGESVPLTLKFEGVQLSGSPNLPTIPGIQIGPGLSSSFNTSIGPDGNAVNVQSFTFNLIPVQAGEITIPTLEVQVAGQKLSSPPLKLKVQQEDVDGPPATMGNQVAFLWPVWRKKELYLHEPLVLELRLYLQSGVRGIGDVQIPLNGDGLVFSKRVDGGNFQRRLGNVPYTVVTLLVAVTPVKTGPLHVDAIQGSVLINPPNQMDAFFGRRADPPVPLTLPAQELQVLPVPTENAPPNFNGAVGNYTMTVTAGPTNVATGDPITVRVQISGSGALDALTLPEQPEWRNFKMYPPTAQLQTSDQFGLDGIKTFEQIVSPESTDIKALPAFSFSYFDPDERAFKTLTEEPVQLTVRPGGAAPMPVVAAGKNASSDATPPPQLDIIPIKQRLTGLRKTGPLLVERTGFIAAQSLPLLAWLAAFVWRRRTDALANNPRLRRQRQVEQTIRNGLQELRQYAAAKKSDEFFATLVKLLQERLGERLNCPATAITEAVIDEKLRPRGVPDATLTALHELFQTCNLARYAPIKSSQELEALIPKLEATLNELQNIKV